MSRRFCFLRVVEVVSESDIGLVDRGCLVTVIEVLVHLNK